MKIISDEQMDKLPKGCWTGEPTSKDVAQAQLKADIQDEIKWAMSECPHCKAIPSDWKYENWTKRACTVCWSDRVAELKAGEGELKKQLPDPYDCAGLSCDELEESKNAKKIP